jgi:hypothetical protein
MDVERQKEIEALLAKPTLARLATASPSGQPHVVPVWFLWEQGAVRISSYQSTRKVKDLERNPRCALVVDLPKAREASPLCCWRAKWSFSREAGPRSASASNGSISNILAQKES